jgi:hypothetical protein
MKGKNKLVPRLLGITKESVLRLDEKTKEVQLSYILNLVFFAKMLCSLGLHGLIIITLSKFL